MAELALLGYNVALLEIDKGDDIFVVDDHTGRLWRVQVKTATPQKRDGHYQVKIDERQITTQPEGENPDRYFVFALRREKERCWRFVIMPRKALKAYIDSRDGPDKKNKKFGSLNKKDGRRTLTMTVSRPRKPQLKSRLKKLGTWRKRNRRSRNMVQMRHGSSSFEVMDHTP